MPPFQTTFDLLEFLHFVQIYNTDLLTKIRFRKVFVLGSEFQLMQILPSFRLNLFFVYQLTFNSMTYRKKHFLTMK